MEAFKKETVSAQKAVEILRGEGLEVTENQAVQILEFLEKLANIAIKQCLMDFESNIE